MELQPELNKKAVDLCKHVVKMTSEAGSGHASSGLSLAHIVTTLMYRIMRYDPSNPWKKTNDRLILSEGHAVPIVYAAYADIGGVVGDRDNSLPLKVDDLSSLRAIDSLLDGHPNPPVGFPFFDAATGSLGQGLSSACGLALADRLDKIDRRHYVLIGDGESREGQVWEACSFLIENDLNSVVPVFNCNGYGQSDTVSEEENFDTLSSKLGACGFETFGVDGHDPAQLVDVFDRIRASGQCSAVIARTVKGWGVSEFQSKNYHGKPLSSELLQEGMDSLDEKLTEGDRRADETRLPSLIAPDEEPRATENAPGKLGPPDFARLLQGDKAMAKLEKGKLSTRRAYGLALRELGELDERVVALDGDVRNSTYSEYFYKSEPERFFECKIAEQNMVSTANGLAATGKRPFVSTFAKFLVRAYDQVELTLISGNKVNFCGSHAGANIGADGPSQMGMTDIAFFRSLTTVDQDGSRGSVVCFMPACAVTAYRCVELMNLHPGITYMRTVRADTPLLYKPDETFEIGGAKILRKGKDAALMAQGFMVHQALKVAEMLKEKSGINMTVVDCYSLPIKESFVRETIENTKGPIFTLEDNYGNSLGAEIASVSSRPGMSNRAVEQLFVKKVPKSGRTSDDVLEYVGLSVEAVAEKITSTLEAWS